MKKIMAIFVMLFVLSLSSCGSNRFKKYDIIVNPMNDGTLKVEYNVEVKAKNLDKKTYVDFYIPDAYNGIYDNFTSLNDNCTSISINEDEVEENKVRYIRCYLSDEAVKNKKISVNFIYELACLYSYDNDYFSYKFFIPEECDNLYWNAAGEPRQALGVIKDGNIYWNNKTQKLKYAFVKYEIENFPDLFLHELKIVEINKINRSNYDQHQAKVFPIFLYSLLIAISVVIIIFIIAIIIRKRGGMIVMGKTWMAPRVKKPKYHKTFMGALRDKE